MFIKEVEGVGDIIISNFFLWKKLKGNTENNETDIKKQKYIFKSLGPVDNVELGKYEDALNQMIEDSSIFNVGLTGPYGAGKSSLIESFKKRTYKKTLFI